MRFLPVVLNTTNGSAKENWDDRLKKVATFATTDEYLLMNGCDHQPVQADLGKAIEVASELYPDINFKHSNFPEYIKAIFLSVGTSLPLLYQFANRIPKIFVPSGDSHIISEYGDS